MIRVSTNMLTILVMSMVLGGSAEWKNVIVDSPFEPVSLGNNCLHDEESERLKALFERLKVDSELQIENDSAALPELYQPDPKREGKFVKRDNHILIDVDYGVRRDVDELIWIIYLPEENCFYVEHRFHRADPHDDRLFGPYRGNPYELLPELEEDLKKRIQTGDSNGLVRMRRMLRQRHPDLSARVAKLIEFGLDLELEVTERARLVDSLRQIFEANQEAFVDGALATQVELIKDRFQEFDREMGALRLEYADNVYMVAEKSAQFDLPETIDESFWGEPVNGLRFAVVPDSATLKFEEIVKVTLIVENVGDRDIKICVHDLVQDVRPDITFEGKRVQTQSTWFSGWPPTNRYLLKPGDQIALAQSSLAAYQSSRPETAAKGFGITSIPVKALQFKKSMQVRHTMRIGSGNAWMRCNDGVMRIYSPAKGEWRGTLTSGGFDIEFRR